MSNLLSWLPWILSGGTVAWIALAIFAPSVIQIVTPIIKAIVEGLIEYLKLLWVGFTDVIDNVATIVFVATVAVLSFLYAPTIKKELNWSTPTITKKHVPKAPVKNKDTDIFTNPLNWR